MPRAKNYRILAVNTDGTYTQVTDGPYYTEKAAAAHVRNNLPAGNYQIVRLYSTETSSDTSAPAIKSAIADVSAEAIAESPLPPSFIKDSSAAAEVGAEVNKVAEVNFIDPDEIF